MDLFGFCGSRLSASTSCLQSSARTRPRRGPGRTDGWKRACGAVVLWLFNLAFPASSFAAACSLPSITVQPESVSVVEGCRATFRVQAAGPGPLTYQWLEEGSVIAGATNAIYITEQVSLAHQGLGYTVVVGNSCGFVVSTPAYLSVVVGLVPPQFARAVAGSVPDRIVLSFRTACEGTGGGLDLISARDVLNYSVSGGLVVTNAELACSGTNVILTTSARPTEGSTYTVTVTGVKDQLGNQVNPGSQAAFRANALLRGAARREVFWGVTGSLASLTNDSRFPTCAEEAGWRTSFEAPRNVGNHYGQRLSALLFPPVTTNYSFALAADGPADLYLSTDEAPRNKRLIAQRTVPSASRAWGCDEPPGCANRSAPVALEAGRAYYLEAVMAEDSWEDHLAVAWTWPGGPALRDGHDPIAGTYLGVYAAAGGQVTILQQPQSATCGVDGQVSFSVVASVQPASNPITYQWQRNSVDIPGANSTTYVTPRLTLSDNLTVYRCFIRAPGLNRNSANAFLTVSSGDTRPPFLLGAVSLAPRRVLTLFSEPVLFAGPASFTVDGVAAVEAQPLNLDDASVVELTLGAALAVGTAHSLLVQDATDATGNAVQNPTAVFVAQQALGFGVPFLRAIPIGSRTVLEWSQGVLLASPGLQGTWSDLPDAISPLVVEPASLPCGVPSPGTFFRLRLGPEVEF